ncbi:MAG TPA: Ig-like domain-containing protein [Anaeromyxobacteraceae bacterium]|nr:Ig-like domain-containing protein [Anaeromyxobacteraceae bacterium]
MKRAFCLVAALAACSPSVKTVTVEPAAVVLSERGAKKTFQAVPKDAKGNPVEGGKQKVVWSSSVPNVASVDEAGTVMSVHSGEAVVSAAVGEAKGSARVVVSIPTAVTVAPAARELRPGETFILSVVVADENGKPVSVVPAPITWSSSDAAIASVSEGRVLAVGPGTATVTAASGPVRGTAQITVRIPEFARLLVKPPKLTLKRGDSLRLRAEPVDRAGRAVGGVPVAWRSSDGRIATVTADGTVHAMKKGKAKITASASGKVATVQLVVPK